MKIWIKRAIRTFIQTAVGYIAVNIAAVDFTDTSITKTAGSKISAVFFAYNKSLIQL